jgi:hypothetical protein
VLAHEQETREIMAEVTIDILIEALKICENEAQIQVNALRYLYNLCYRCESGQACILQRKPKNIINRIRNNFSGDITINTQLRRFELSLKLNGWRGNVEEVIEKEMKDEEVESTALKSIKLMSDAEFEAMFSGGAALNERNIEDDLQSYKTKGSLDSANTSIIDGASSYHPEETMESKSPSRRGLDAGESFHSAGLQEMSAITHK